MRFLKRTFATVALLLLFSSVPAVLAQNSFQPTLSIPIPTVLFSDIKVEGANKETGASGYVDIPWIAQYINGIYLYAVSIAGIIVSVTIVIGGFQYMTGKPAEGKEKIRRSLTGLVLVFGSYIILQTINPDITKLTSLRVKTVERQELIAEPGGIDYGVSDPGTPVPGGETNIYDDLFKKYSACAGLDWRIVKAVAKKESAFNATVVNKFGFTGLLQVGKQFCSLGDYGRGSECTISGLKNPDANVAAASSGQLRSGANILRSVCPKIKDTRRFVMLLYFGHNSGPGALKSVLAAVGCNATNEEFNEAASNFWASKNKSGKPIPNQNGRMQYALKVAESAIAYGVTDPFSTTGACPLGKK